MPANLHLCLTVSSHLEKQKNDLKKIKVVDKFIGVFDSGVGGLSIMKELIIKLPEENFLYIADQKRIPYGTKSQNEIRNFSEKITRFLLAKGAKCIVISCNTASAAALSYLRKEFPNIPFIGIEPAIKPAAEKTKTKKIGVLATKGTFESERYTSLIERFANGIEILANPCIGLVELIEKGKIEHKETIELLSKILNPMILKGIDSIVLGCTHYPFIQPILERMLPKNVIIINPASAVAHHTRNRLAKLNILVNQEKRKVQFYTTGNSIYFQEQIKKLLQIDRKVNKLNW